MPKEVWRERKSGYLYQPRTLTPARTNQGVRSKGPSTDQCPGLSSRWEPSAAGSAQSADRQSTKKIFQTVTMLWRAGSKSRVVAIRCRSPSAHTSPVTDEFPCLETSSPDAKAGTIKNTNISLVNHCSRRVSMADYAQRIGYCVRPASVTFLQAASAPRTAHASSPVDHDSG